MCGIVGIYSKDKNIDKKQVEAAVKLLEHRGPDDSGFYFDENIGLGHRRLSIIDLSEKGKQPMSNETGDIQLVYNGEIYNFKEIKEELEKLGHEFKSLTDSEVIVHAYEEWQEACLKRFNGMFAFALWDSKNKKLFIARDRAGVKPLYYHISGGNLVFASEIKALFEFGIPKSINKKVLYDYFNYFILIGDGTLFEGIKSLPPAHYFIMQDNKITSKKYWDFDYSIEEKSEEEWIKLIEQNLTESVRKRMISDVSVGAFLSGGIDSSLIVALMKKFSSNVKTFCVGSGDDTELKNARFISEKLGTEHHEILVTSEDFAKNLKKMVWHYDMPLSFASSVPLYFVSQLSKGKATVILTGEGADELLAGYNRYRLMVKLQQANKKINFLPEGLRKNISSVISNTYSDPRYKKNIDMLMKGFNFDYATGINIFLGREREEILQNTVKESIWNDKVLKFYNEKETSFLNRILYLDLKTYLVELLMKQDKMSMAASIESRVPFLDYSLIENFAKIPPSLKLNGNIGKYILKKTAESLIPKETVYQKKIGFTVPLNNWFKGELNGFLKDNLLTENGAISRFFDMARVKRMIDMQKRKNYSLQLWALLNFKIWTEEFEINS